MTEQNDYPYIRAWGKLLGSFHYYVREQVEQARADRAPTNATHRKVDGTWATTDDITRAETRRQLGLEPLPPLTPELSHLIPVLLNALQHDDELLDRYGMNGVSVSETNILAVQFSTGWTALLEVSLQIQTNPT